MEKGGVPSLLASSMPPVAPTPDLFFPRVEAFGDKLTLRGMRFHGFHGVHEKEKIEGQLFIVDVDAWMDLRRAGQTDNLKDTVTYTDIHRIVKEVVEGRSYNLLESVVDSIAAKIFESFMCVSCARICVGKPQVAAAKKVDYLGVEIFRTSPLPKQHSSGAEAFKDKVTLRGMRFHGFHGVCKEKTEEQLFMVDVDAWMDLRRAGQTDNLEDTVSYSTIREIVEEVAEGRPYNLLESVVDSIAAKIFESFPCISCLRICMGKPQVAATKKADYLGVEIFRTSPLSQQHSSG